MIKNNFVYRARIENVVDGDTVDLYVDKGFRDYMRDRFRLAYIDTPERNEKGYVDAKNFVEQFKGHWLTIQTEEDSRGGFNRWLAEVFLDEYEGGTQTSLNALLIEKGLAELYK